MATQVAGVFSHFDKGDGKEYSIAPSAYGYCETAAATAAKVVDMTGFELKKGVTIFVKFKERNNVANPTLNVNGTGAKVIYRYGTTRPNNNDSTNGWPAGAVLAFTYDGSAWIEHYWYNNQYGLGHNAIGSGNFTAATVVYRYQLLFHQNRDVLSPLNNVDNNTGTSKTMLTTMEFDPFELIYYYDSTTAVAANGSINGGALYYTRSGLDLRYTFNCGQTLTAHKDVYLKCSKQSNGKFRIASASPLVQELPTTDDGFYYLRLGRASSTYQMSLYQDHPIYYYDGTTIREYRKTRMMYESTSEALIITE